MEATVRPGASPCAAAPSLCAERRGGVLAVDSESSSVELFALEDGRYKPQGCYTHRAGIVSPSLPGLDLPVRRLFP